MEQAIEKLREKFNKVGEFTLSKKEALNMGFSCENSTKEEFKINQTVLFYLNAQG